MTSKRSQATDVKHLHGTVRAADIIDALNELSTELEEEICRVNNETSYDTFDRGFHWGLIKAGLLISQKRQSLLPEDKEE